MKIYNLIILVAMLISNSTIAQEKKEGIKAKIFSEINNNLISINNSAINNSDYYGELEYLFVSIKKSREGNMSSNKQSGKFSLSPKSTKKLSETTVNLGANDELKCYLYIKDENTKELISKDSLIINPKKKL